MGAAMLVASPPTISFAHPSLSGLLANLESEASSRGGTYSSYSIPRRCLYIGHYVLSVNQKRDHRSSHSEPIDIPGEPFNDQGNRFRNVWQNHSIAWYNQTIMGTLSDILSSRVRAEIFRLLFGLDEKELHLREMERQAGLSLGTIRQDLQKLVKLDLVKTRRDSNRLYQRANVEHPLFPEIRNMVLKTSGLVEILREALDKEGVKVAFIFGSLAIGRENAGSDVDLMVIGTIGLRTLSKWLSGVSDQIGREINPVVWSMDEFRQRQKKGNHFLSNVLESPKLFVIGSEKDLENGAIKTTGQKIERNFSIDLN
jgi:predicted nucleotidyltransferase